jgi:uncharacterized protein (TIGR02246 family)
MTEITELFDRLHTTWAAGDADAFAECYTEAGTVVVPGAYQRGRDNVRRFTAEAFAGPLRGSTVTDEPLDTRVDGDGAIVVTRSRLTPVGADPRDRHATWVLSKVDGRWLVAAYTSAPAH